MRWDLPQTQSLLLDMNLQRGQKMKEKYPRMSISTLTLPDLLTRTLGILIPTMTHGKQ